jgi:uncharacterized Fe-S cluster-containing radical SAM superfamily protein
LEQSLRQPTGRNIGKFEHPAITAKGERRAAVALKRLETLWFNTGTLCNITCRNCYIESSPKNDALAYLTLGDVQSYLDEIRRDGLPVTMIGLTGGEPFMNREIIAILEAVLAAGYETLVLTNAMRPMMRHKADLLRLRDIYGARLRIRVSLDDYRAAVHDAERGPDAFRKAMDGLRFLSREGFRLELAGRRLGDDAEVDARAGYARMLAEEGIAIACDDPVALVIFPEMGTKADPPEITEACWNILHKSPDDVMCASARMVVRRKGAEAPVVLACTLIAYDSRFELGHTLAEAAVTVPLAHRSCATFCVLGGAACGAAAPA